MTGTDDLERAYRRWLRLYPRAFRREHDEEILAVLLAGAKEGQRRPELLDCLDLLRGALWLHVRPRVPRSNRPVFSAMKLLCLGAVVELVTVIMIAGTMGDVRANVVARDPDFSASQWHAAVASQLEPNVIGGSLAILFWLVMAWFVGRGYRFVRPAFALFCGVNLYGLCTGLANGAATYSRPDLALGIIVCLVAFVSAIAIFRLKTAVSGEGAGPAMAAG